MATKAEIEKAEMKDLIDALNIPQPIPDSFVPDLARDPGGAWTRGLREIDALGLDRSGPDKSYRALRRIAAAFSLVGASVNNWRQYLRHAEERKGEAERRIPIIERRGLDAGPDQATLASTQKDIGRWGPLVAWADSWTGKSTAELQGEVSEAGNPEGLLGEIERRRLAGVPLADLAPMQRELHEMRKRHSAASKAYQHGRKVFDQLGEMLKRAIAQANQAMAGTLLTAEDHLATKARETVGADLAFAVDFPDAAPPELDALFRRSAHIGGILEQLTGDPHAGVARFLDALGAELEYVVCKRAGLPARLEAESEGDSMPETILSAIY